MENAKLILDGVEYELPVEVGTEGEVAVDVQSLRKQSGAITFDSGYGNTGSCESAITFIDGEKGILRYRGYPIEQVAASSRFSEVCYLLVYGRLPNQKEYDEFSPALDSSYADSRRHEEVLRRILHDRSSHGHSGLHGDRHGHLLQGHRESRRRRSEHRSV